MTATTQTRPGPPAGTPAADFQVAPPTVEELGRAWDALRAGRFRDGDRAQEPGSLRVRESDLDGTVQPIEAATVPLPGPTVIVVGAHGWAGASTTALLLAEAAARAGRNCRLVDAADGAASGLVGAAVTEHGHDGSGRWRCGTRPVRSSTGQSSQVRIQRLDQPAGTPSAVPAAPVSDTAAEPAVDLPVTVVDAGWPLHELLRMAHDPAGRAHWLAQLLRGSTVVLTARATVPALQRAGAAAAELQQLRVDTQNPAAGPVLLALVGAHRLPRLMSEVLGAALPMIRAEGRVVLLPGHRDLAVQGVTSSDLPRRLATAGAQLLRMTSDPTEDARPPRRGRDWG